ncbi:hypothetical protein BBP40_008659 [Aspergillus hancockii]|nr:hypothetical protein BBP40_008659 [Aspergillus hancockii]
MVNWKNVESTDRLIASLLAAHPGWKPDYYAMALMFGQGATYDSIEARFRRYRKIADELKDEARSKGTEIPKYAGRSPGSSASTPRTPRGPRSGITKRVLASSGNGKKDPGQAQTPTKKKGKRGMSLMDAISVDDGTTEEESMIKPEDSGIVSDGGGDDVQMIDPPLGAQPSSSSSSAAAAAAAAVADLTAKIKKEKIERKLAKNEEEEEGTLLKAKTARPSKLGVHDQEGAALDPAGLEDDPFYMTGSYLTQVQADYGMDDIYGEAA